MITHPGQLRGKQPQLRWHHRRRCKNLYALLRQFRGGIGMTNEATTGRCSASASSSVLAPTPFRLRQRVATASSGVLL